MTTGRINQVSTFTTHTHDNQTYLTAISLLCKSIIEGLCDCHISAGRPSHLSLYSASTQATRLCTQSVGQQQQQRRIATRFGPVFVVQTNKVHFYCESSNNVHNNIIYTHTHTIIIIYATRLR